MSLKMAVVAGSKALFASVLLNIFVLSLTGADAPKRRLITVMNPDLPAGKDCGGGLAYVRAEGDHDTLHYLVTTVGTPTVLVLQTSTVKDDVNPEIKIDWNKLMSNNLTENAGAISLSADVKLLYSYGVMFTRLFQYNDTHDKADITYYGPDSTTWDVFDLTSATWQNLDAYSSNDLIVLQIKEATGKHTTIVNGSLTLKFHFYDTADRAKDMPHLEYSQDVTQFDLLLSDIDTSNITMARYAIEAILFSNDPKKFNMKIVKKESIDDEYSPGVFTIYNWLSQSSHQAEGGYMQWKPVCYTSSSRVRADATTVKKYGPYSVEDHHISVDNSIVYDFFTGNGKMNDLRMKASNFSFGLTKDGTFVKTNYTVWSATLGYGVPFEDKVSTLVIGVISAGLGLPVILIIFGGVFILIKKRLAPKIVTSSNSRNIIN